MEEKTNTIYVLSLSYGKDSLACLGAIEKLGLPLDRIVHAEVWATETIPADLPPMVEFKKKADKIIKERYGIEVEHVFATKKNGGGCLHTEKCLEQQPKLQSTGSISMVSPSNLGRGVQVNLNKTCLPKLTYEDIFYREMKHRGGGYKIIRLPYQARAMVQQPTQSQRTQLWGSQTSGRSIVRGNSNEQYSTERICGFPISINRGNWCTQLKTRVFFKPENDGRYKYRAVSWDCERRTRTN